MDIRQIKIGGVLHSVGDIVLLNEYKKFLFWEGVRRKKYKITFIGDDCSAVVSDGKRTKTIIGSVNIINQ